MSYEVLHGDIRITLSDADAIRGLERTRRAVKRQMSSIARERAVVSIEGNLKDLKRSLREAEALVKRHQKKVADLEKEREGLSGAQKGALTRRINAETKIQKQLEQQVDILRQQRDQVQYQLEQRKRLNKEAALGTKLASERAKEEDAVADAIERENKAYQSLGREQARALGLDQKRTQALEDQERAYARMQSQAMRMDEQRTQGIEDQERAYARMQASAERLDRDREKRLQSEGQAMARIRQQAIDADQRRTMEIISQQREVARLQQQYDKANQSYQKMTKTGKMGRAVSPRLQQEFDINQREVLGEMAVLRAKLAALGADPVDIQVNLKESRIMEKLAGIGDIGMRLGPFTGTLKQFTIAALALGPILTGLLGATTALGGALATGLTGALGIAGTGLLGFGGALGVAFAGIKPHYDDLAGIIKRSKDYANKVEQYGKNSEEAGKAQEKLKHIMGDVDDATLEAFKSLQGLGDRWGDLTKSIRPDFFETIGVGINSLNRALPMLARNSERISGTLFEGMREWAKGLSSVRGQSVINTILGNTDAGMKPMLKALGALGAAFGKVTASFSRHFRPIMQDFQDWADGLNKAADNTNKLDSGVDNLVDSFRDVWGVMSAFGNLLTEIAQVAMGPGGDMMDNMADGLNRIAGDIERNPAPLREFFEGSIETMAALYGLLKPIMALFLEFSTILRPLTNIALDFAAAIARIVEAIAGFGPMRTLLTGLISAWFLKRANIAVVGLMTGALNGLAAALVRVGAVAGAAGLARLGGMIGAAGAGIGRRVGRPVIAGAPGGAAVATTGARSAAQGAGYRAAPTFIPRGVTPPPIAPAGGAAAAASAGRLAKLGTAASAATGALLGVSAPVVALGAAAVGAGFAIKGIINAANDREALQQRVGRQFGPGGVQDAKPKLPAHLQGSRFAAIDNTQTYERERKALQDAAIAAEGSNVAMRASIQLRRELVNVADQRLSAELNVEMAEKAYSAAVKNSGKNSLEARVALQGLRQARRDEAAATEQWKDALKEANHYVATGIALAQKAYEQAKGTNAEDEAFAKLEKAKDEAEAFRLAVGRAKNGLDAFSGEGATKLGHFVRQFAGIKGFKRIMLRVETQKAAMDIAEVVDKLDAAGKRRAVARILADTKNPEEALRRLELAYDRYEKRVPVAKLKADKKQAQFILDAANDALDFFGKRKPEALLKARDEAKAKVQALNKQLDGIDGKTVTARVKVDFNTAFNASPGGDAAQGDGWGAGVPNVRGKISDYAKKNKDTLVKKLFLGGGLGSAEIGGSGLNAFNGIAGRFGVSVGSGFRPGSITSSGNLSYHAMGRARDFPGPPAAMMQFARFMAATFGSRLKELIYTPLGFSIKDGRRVPPFAPADHIDHVHVAMAQGGKVKPGRYSQPTVLFAEEPNHPEYFISTNPRDKKRSRRLIAQAAAEVGLLEHTPAFHAMEMANGGWRTAIGDFAVSGVKSDERQTRLLWRVNKIVNEMKGVPQRAKKALFMAIMHESQARNLNRGDRTSTGPLQVLSSTARGMGIDPRNLEQITKAFLRKGFWGKGSAISLAKRGLSPEMIAHMVQGNATGTGVYRRELGGAESAMRAFARVAAGKNGTVGGKKAVRGARNTFAAKLAGIQGGYDVAKSTPGLADDLMTLTGRTGLIATTKEGRRRDDKRLKAINKRLKGKLTPAKRKALLAEKEQLITGRASSRVALTELRTERDTAAFEIQQEVAGRGTAQRAMATATASTTKTLDDDIAAAKLEVAYWKDREKWARDRNDLAGAAEAVTNWQTASEQIKTLEEQARDAIHSREEASINYRSAQVATTKTLTDDLALARFEYAYWKQRRDQATALGDMSAAAGAFSNMNNATTNIESLTDQIARLPLERDLANAALTETLADDKLANEALRDYWKAKHTAAKASGDIAAEIEAAGNLKQYQDAVNAAEESVALQSKNLSDARLQLFRAFGSNFIQTVPTGTKAYTPSTVYNQTGTTVNVTNNFQSQPSDPLTFASGVAWELQAVV
jgi:hypothetical protein